MKKILIYGIHPHIFSNNSLLQQRRENRKFVYNVHFYEQKIEETNYILFMSKREIGHFSNKMSVIRCISLFYCILQVLFSLLSKFHFFICLFFLHYDSSVSLEF